MDRVVITHVTTRFQRERVLGAIFRFPNDFVPVCTSFNDSNVMISKLAGLYFR